MRREFGEKTPRSAAIGMYEYGAQRSTFSHSKALDTMMGVQTGGPAAPPVARAELRTPCVLERDVSTAVRPHEMRSRPTSPHFMRYSVKLARGAGPNSIPSCTSVARFPAGYSTAP